MKFWYFVILFHYLFSDIDCNESCNIYQTCGECMKNAKCQWCAQDDYDQGPRCSEVSSYSQCSDVVNLKNEQEIILNSELSLQQLIKPQQVNLKLRPGVQHNLTFTIGQSVNYPVDVYFLFDLSFSMNKSRNTLAEQAGRIVDKITDITEDYRIGFGSFIDKDVAPFTSTNDEFNCPKDVECRNPYSFYHQRSLSITFWKSCHTNETNS